MTELIAYEHDSDCGFYFILPALTGRWKLVYGPGVPPDGDMYVERYNGDFPPMWIHERDIVFAPRRYEIIFDSNT